MEEKNKLNTNGEFEDIISDTGKAKPSLKEDITYFDTYSDSKYFKKNRHGIKKIFAVGDWWRERKTWQKTVMITSLSLVLVFAILLTVVLTVFDYNYNSITNDPEDLGFEQVIDKKIINIALFGIDTREKNSFKGLSDSIMILSLNTETKTVKIISVMRDTLVPITYNGKTSYGKINSAYQKGGPELAIKTLNTIFGLDISEYATVNFFGMADIIEAVGGIEVELTQGELTGKNNINDCVNEICASLGISPEAHRVKTAGKQHVNGVQAVAYSRIRYVANIWGTNNDYGRTDRQRYVMEQLFNKALTLDKMQYVKLAKALIPCAETSLSYSEIMGLATSILLHSPSFEQTRVPLTEYQIGSKSVPGAGSCVYYDLDYAEKIIHAFIYDNVTPEDYMEQNGVEKNDWYKGSVNKPSSSGSGSGSGSGSSGNDGDTVPPEDDEPSEPDTDGGEGTPEPDPENPEDGDAENPENPEGPEDDPIDPDGSSEPTGPDSDTSSETDGGSDGSEDVQ